MTIAAGTRLGAYEVISPIGAGGMGEVYKARDTRLERTIAIKVLPEHFADRGALRERFEREAKTIASLNHPHICTLYDVGREGGTDYLVMEYIEGETLAQRLAKGPLPLQQVLQYAIEIADALDKAHRKGITHRDLKPGNITLTKGGTKLLDFGLAKLKQEVAPASAQLTELPTAKDPLTAQGTLLGTLQYMAPEQVEGKEVDARTDIFAFGAVVYEMTTGKRAFEGKTQASLIAKILEIDPPPISSLQPMTPPALDRVVKKCLAKEPDDRWHAAKDLCDEVKWIADGGSQPGLPVPNLVRRKSREHIAWSIAVAAIVAALAVSAIHLLQAPKPGLPLQAVMLPPKDHSFFGSFFALAPDGKKIAFVASDLLTGTRTLWVRSLDSTTAQPLAGAEGALGLFWSPDSKFIGFVATTNLGRVLKKIDAGGGPAITLAGDVGGAVRGTWGADGTIVLSRGAPEGLSEVSSNGGPVSPLTHLDTTRGEGQHRWVFFLPDGRHLLFEVDIADPAHGGMAYETRVLDLKTMKQNVLLRADSNVEYANGYLLYIQQANLVAQPFDVSSLTLLGDPVPVVQQVLVTANAMGAFSASSSGLLAFEGGSGANSQLVWYTRDGKESGQVGSPGLYTMPSLSPDGTKAIVSLAQGNKRDIWVFELARSVATRVTVSTKPPPGLASMKSRFGLPEKAWSHQPLMSPVTAS
jgi:serine/threonine protein kinase/Tol biopolymer transport system component